MIKKNESIFAFMFAVMPAEKYLEDRPGSYVHIQ